eukprot:4776266-Pyramimonas_sp.AAC.1
MSVARTSRRVTVRGVPRRREAPSGPPLPGSASVLRSGVSAPPPFLQSEYFGAPGICALE